MPNRLIPTDHITGAIRVIRGQRVLLDADLAKLYDVETRMLNQAVRRNSERFPDDFMFQLTSDEDARLRSQIVILDAARGRHRQRRDHARIRAATAHTACCAAAVIAEAAYCWGRSGCNSCHA